MNHFFVLTSCAWVLAPRFDIFGLKSGERERRLARRTATACRGPCGGVARSVGLLPVTLAFPRENLANDRQLYLAPVGPAWLVGVWFVTLAGAQPAAVVPAAARRSAALVTGCVVVLLVTAFGALTVARNRVYTSETHFWWITAQTSRGRARVRNNLGIAHSRNCRDEDARAAPGQAAETGPDAMRPPVNLKPLALGRLVPDGRRHCGASPTGH